MRSPASRGNPAKTISSWVDPPPSVRPGPVEGQAQRMDLQRRADAAFWRGPCGGLGIVATHGVQVDGLRQPHIARHPEGLARKRRVAWSPWRLFADQVSAGRFNCQPGHINMLPMNPHHIKATLPDRSNRRSLLCPPALPVRAAASPCSVVTNSLFRINRENCNQAVDIKCDFIQQMTRVAPKNMPLPVILPVIAHEQGAGSRSVAGLNGGWSSFALSCPLSPICPGLVQRLSPSIRGRNNRE